LQPEQRIDLGSGIGESARIVHFAQVDESRRRTLLTLIELATENSPSACWDDRRATEILRRDSNPEELRELGVEERMIEFVFAEPRGEP
jgi:hypothetical protein